MAWELRSAPFAKVYRALAARGRPVPATVARPTVKPESAWLLDSFMVLSSHRQSSGFGVSPLSISDIEAYTRLAGLESADDRFAFLEVISALDDVYLRWSVDQRGDRKDNPTSKS